MKFGLKTHHYPKVTIPLTTNSRLKIEYSYLINDLALLIAYDGISKVAAKSNNTLNIPTQLFKKVKYRKEILSYEKLHNEAKQNIEEVYPVLNIGLKNEFGIPHEIDKSINRYNNYFKQINDFKNKYFNPDNNTLGFINTATPFYQIPNEKVFAKHYHSK